MFRCIVLEFYTQCLELIACIRGKRRVGPFPLRFKKESKAITANLKCITDRILYTYDDEELVPGAASLCLDTHLLRR